MAVGGKVKGITIEFNGDTTKLGNALKQIDSKSKSVDRSLQQVNRALRFNPKNTELVAQKQTLLAQKINQTRERLVALENTQKKLDDDPSVEKDSQEYMELRREIITTESKLKHFQAEQKKLNNIKFTNLGNSFKNAGSKITSVGRTITTTFSLIGAAGIYAGKKLIESSQKQAQAEQKLAEIYKTRMGADKQAVKSTLALASAQQKVGVVGDEVALSFAQQMATYSKTPATVNKLIPAFENLLVQQKGLNGTQEDAVGLANMFGKAMMGQAGALKRAGISFTDAQAEVLKYGTEEEKASMLAEVITQNVGHMNEEFAKTDAGKIQQAKNALGDMGEEIGAILLPAVADLVKWLQDNVMPKMEEFIGWLKEHPQVAKFALALAAVGTVAGPIIMIIGNIVTVIGTLIKVLPLLGRAITSAFGPWGLLIAGVIAAAILLYKNWDKVKKFLLKIWNAIKKAFLTVFNAIKTAIITYWKTIWTITKTIWTTIFNVLKTIWNAIKTAAMVVLNAIVGLFKKAWAAIKAAWAGVKSFFIGIWNGIKSAFANVGTWFAAKFLAAANAVKSAFNSVKSFFSGVWSKIKGAFGNVGGWFKQKFASAASGIKSAFSGIASFFGGIVNKIKGKFKDIGSKVGGAIKGGVATAINAVIGLAEKAINKAIGIINGAINVINKIIPGKAADVGKVPKVSFPRISWHKKGGIFDSPSVIGVGEAGAEAVVPLNKFWDKLDKMAEGASSPIVVNVYGSENMNVNELAVAVQNKIIQLQKRKNSAWA